MEKSCEVNVEVEGKKIKKIIQENDSHEEVEIYGNL